MSVGERGQKREVPEPREGRGGTGPSACIVCVPAPGAPLAARACVCPLPANRFRLDPSALGCWGRGKQQGARLSVPSAQILLPVFRSYWCHLVTPSVEGHTQTCARPAALSQLHVLTAADEAVESRCRLGSFPFIFMSTGTWMGQIVPC